VTATEAGTAGDALCRRRDRLPGARRYCIRRRTLTAAAMFCMAHFKAAPVRRTCATRADAAAGGIDCHSYPRFTKKPPIMLCPSDQIWSHKGIVKYHYLRRLHLIGFVLRIIGGAPLAGLLRPFLFSPGPQPHSRPPAFLLNWEWPALDGCDRPDRSNWVCNSDQTTLQFPMKNWRGCYLKRLAVP
jgi:hypothetical protein